MVLFFVWIVSTDFIPMNFLYRGRLFRERRFLHHDATLRPPDAGQMPTFENPRWSIPHHRPA